MTYSAITSPYEEEERGYPPYHPVMMTQVLLYGYAVGVYSGRRLAKALETRLSSSRSGQARHGGDRWDQDQGECQQAQGDEP